MRVRRPPPTLPEVISQTDEEQNARAAPIPSEAVRETGAGAQKELEAEVELLRRRWQASQRAMEAMAGALSGLRRAVRALQAENAELRRSLRRRQGYET
jgi:predicted RNase H-like nuclease (RuvC/YqgF family)